MKIALALAALALVAAAPDAAPKPAKATKVLIDLTPAEMDATRLLPPPPAEGSPRALAELAELKRIAASTPAARYTQAKWDDDHEDPTLFQPLLGSGFDMAALPATAALLELVQTDAGVSASAAKKVFARKRPWAVDAAIKTCDPDDKPLTSYPSGHATLGYALALTLAEAMPDKSQALLTRASDYAYSREICGSHFASDTQASQALATAMVTKLMTKPGFQAKLAAAKTELSAHTFVAN